MRKAYKLYKIGGVVSEVLYSPAAYGVDLSTRDAPKPKARIGAGMAVVRNALWVFGGVVEVLDRDISLDDIWCLDLMKLNGWQCVKPNSAGEEVFQEVEDEESDSESSGNG